MRESKDNEKSTLLPAQPKDILFVVLQLVLQRLAMVVHRVDCPRRGLEMRIGGTVTEWLGLCSGCSCVHGDRQGGRCPRR
jgi:hypothetical protein